MNIASDPVWLRLAKDFDSQFMRVINGDITDVIYRDSRTWLSAFNHFLEAQNNYCCTGYATHSVELYESCDTLDTYVQGYASYDGVQCAFRVRIDRDAALITARKVHDEIVEALELGPNDD